MGPDFILILISSVAEGSGPLWFQKARSWAYNPRVSSSGVFEIKFPGNSVALLAARLASVDGVLAIELMKKKNSYLSTSLGLV